MGKSALKVKFDPTPFRIGPGWFVRVRLPNGDQTQISGFFNEAEARDWIATESAAWLK
jgi:NAD(P)H-flavin reductase